MNCGEDGAADPAPRVWFSDRENRLPRGAAAGRPGRPRKNFQSCERLGREPRISMHRDNE